MGDPRDRGGGVPVQREEAARCIEDAPTALGVTLLGFSIGARAARITPSWQQGLGILGAALLLVAGLASMAVAGGSPIVYVGFVGFACWLAWLVTTGVRLLR